MNVFIVSLRKDAVDGINITNEVTGTMDQLSADTDFLDNFHLNGAVFALNSDKLKIHASNTSH